MEEVYIAWTTYPEEEVAKENARRLVEQKFAACIWVMKSHCSIYWWENQVQMEEEWVLMIKTTKSRIPDVQTTILEHHPYRVAEFIAFPAGVVSEPYLRWVMETVVG